MALEWSLFNTSTLKGAETEEAMLAKIKEGLKNKREA